MRYEKANELACTPAQLWPWLSEPERMKQWMTGLIEMIPEAPGPVRVGATYRVRIQEGRKVSEYREEMMVYEPLRKIRVKFTGGSFGTMLFFAENELVDLGHGRTRLRYAGWSEGGPWWCKVLAPIGKLMVSMQTRSFHKKLKQLVEAEARSHTSASARS